MDSEYESEEEQELDDVAQRGKKEATTKKAKGKGGGAGKKSDEIRRRSTKACDGCRKSKCKCTRTSEDITAPCTNCTITATACTYIGISRKRGPPKGYIEAVESRLRRMEELLGGLLENEDPRAEALLGELIGHEQAHELMTKDLLTAAAAASTKKSSKKKSTILASKALPSSALAPASIASSSKSLGFDGASMQFDGNAAWNSDNNAFFPGLADSTMDSNRPCLAEGLQSFVAVESPHYLSISTSLPSNSSDDPSSFLASPRQRRKVEPALAATTTTITNESPVAEETSMAYSFAPRKSSSLDRSSVGHTGYGRSGEDQVAVTELEDVFGQLSMNENNEVRYHGRSSGLYLIAKSNRYKDFFWRMPAPGTSPQSPGVEPKIIKKTEAEVLAIVGVHNPLPSLQRQQDLLDLYFTYVHPHFPIMFQSSFVRQYKYSIANPHSTEFSTSAGAGKVPVVLLLAMFAIASRYSDSVQNEGDAFFENACRILNYDFRSSKIVNCQVMLLLAYREIGAGGMSSAWMYTGMAIRLAQDLGLFRDVDKWSLPVQRFSHEEKQTRKRVWWGAIMLDRYVSTFIGRPSSISERDYEISFVSENEPEEHEQWRPLRLDGTEWGTTPKRPVRSGDMDPGTSRYPSTMGYTLSCFNAASALAVIINRIISGVYSIRVRVLGQSSEKLLSLLDQSLASWFLALAPELSYNIGSKRVPPPHILALHLQFYSALILLHRPFIPGSSDRSDEACFPSHAICTTSANAIANIVSIFSKTFTLRQCPPFVTYPIFSAAIICVYNAGFDEALAVPAKKNLRVCMDALRESAQIWNGAARQWELLHGLVDLRLGPADVNGEGARGAKRAADVDDIPTSVPSIPEDIELPDQRQGLPSPMPVARPHLPIRRRSGLSPLPVPNRNLSPASPPANMINIDPYLEPSRVLNTSFISPLDPTPLPLPPDPMQHHGVNSAPIDTQFAAYMPTSLEGAIHNSYDILNYRDVPQLSSEFRARSGTSTPSGTNYTDLLNMVMTGTGVPMTSSGLSSNNLAVDSFGDTNYMGTAFDMNNSFSISGMPLGVDVSLDSEWRQFLPNAFFSPSPAAESSQSPVQSAPVV